ncbi:MAG: prenyltransferase/squalene oxidase repeat-containing protein [Thermoguttaceae bacterium]
MAEQSPHHETPEKAAHPVDVPDEMAQLSHFERARIWLVEEGPWWLCSFVFHLVIVCSLAVIGGRTVQKLSGDAPPTFEQAKVEEPVEVPTDLKPFDPGHTPEDPTKSELNTAMLTAPKPGSLAGSDDKQDGDVTDFSPSDGGGSPATAKEQITGGLGSSLRGVGPGPALFGKGGVGIGPGTGVNPGVGGSGTGYGWRKGPRGNGTTQIDERAVAAALNWLARHQSASGSWGLASYKGRCKDGTCSGPGRSGDRLTAATALGLLPYLAAGQTHKSKGPYQRNIAAGVRFLTTHQKSNGDLRMGGQMYDHGLAAIALCECYGMTGDSALRPHAQAALDFIVAAQDPKEGGWRYEPHDPGDTSVVGWQLMALKSGQMAYLPVNPAVFDKAKQFLKSVSYGQYGGHFSYMPGGRSVAGDDRATTAIALLCHQYMGMARNNAVMGEGTSFLMDNLPDVESHNLYYWYYATMAMHNQPGKEWDTWNRKMRRLLIATQSREGCAMGSWNCTNGKDQWADHGGRLMMTSLAALTLEVYYRYLPLYKLDGDSRNSSPSTAAKKDAAPTKKGAAAPAKKSAAGAKEDESPPLEEPDDP